MTGVCWLANLALFVVFFVGMVIAGVQVYNNDQSEHGQADRLTAGYLGTGDFVEATFENWESEFLQMGMYVVLTAFLFQRGSSESKPIDEPAPQDEDPRDQPTTRTRPGRYAAVAGAEALRELAVRSVLRPVRWRRSRLHAVGGAAAYSEEQLLHGEPAVSFLGYLGTSQFWFESFQNWQSEFLAVAVIVGASVYLRQRGSAESKPVAAPHAKTGS